jgi:hypothetical protein
MKQQYCDTDLITFNLQGLLWITKSEYTFVRGVDTSYNIDLQYKNQSISVKFPDEKTRDTAYEKARLLIVPPKNIEE